MRGAFNDLLPLVPILMMAFTRVSVALAALPGPFGSHSPVTIRVALSIFLAIATTLPIRDSLPTLPWDPYALGFAAIGEAIVGLAIGLIARCALAVAEVAGDFAANSMGLSFASSISPSTGEQSQLTTHLLGFVAVVVFMAVNGHHAVIAALAASMRAAPPGMAIMAYGRFGGLVRVGADMMSDGLRMASPVVASMLLVQVAVGFTSRAASRIQIFPLSFATAVTTGLIALWVAAPSMLYALGRAIDALPAEFDTILGGL